MTIAYACDLNVYVCVNFGDEIMLRGEECKNSDFGASHCNSSLIEQYILGNDCTDTLVINTLKIDCAWVRNTLLDLLSTSLKRS